MSVIKTQVSQTDCVPPISVSSTTATVVNVVDTAGNYALALFEFDFGTMAGDLSACKLQQSSASTQPGTFADITSATLSDLTAATLAGKTAYIAIRLMGYSRYLRPIITTTGGASLVSCNCKLYQEWELPYNYPYGGDSTQFIEVSGIAQ